MAMSAALGMRYAIEPAVSARLLSAPLTSVCRVVASTTPATLYTA